MNLISAEEKELGVIGLSIYSEYLSQSPGSFCNVCALVSAIVPFLLMGYLRLFIASWASLPLSEQGHSDKRVLYVGLSVTVILISVLTSFLIGCIFIHLSNSLHNSMLERVARAPILFFNSNPLGRIINRFSRDTAMADTVVTFLFVDWLQVSFANS